MGYVWVGVSGWGVLGYVWVCAGVFRCMWSMHECMQDEFSEYLLETRVITSSDFNMYPIQKKFPYFLKILGYFQLIREKFAKDAYYNSLM